MNRKKNRVFEQVLAAGATTLVFLFTAAIVAGLVPPAS
jgi:hypothetical protein